MAFTSVVECPQLIGVRLLEGTPRALVHGAPACADNAAMEAFWVTLKKEVHHIWGPINSFTRSQMRTILFDYIEVFYNRSRHQQGLDDRIPAEVYAATRAA